jgi:hypothetical protein
MVGSWNKIKKKRIPSRKQVQSRQNIEEPYFQNQSNFQIIVSNEISKNIFFHQVSAL